MVPYAEVVAGLAVPLLSFTAAIGLTWLSVRLGLTESRDIRETGVMYGRSLDTDHDGRYERPSSAVVFFVAMFLMMIVTSVLLEYLLSL